MIQPEPFPDIPDIFPDNTKEKQFIILSMFKK
jgi:hypothetical protein